MLSEPIRALETLESELAELISGLQTFRRRAHDIRKTLKLDQHQKRGGVHEALVAIMRGDADWTVRDLLSALERRGQAPQGRKPYISVHMALRRHPWLFRQTSRTTWALASGAASVNS